MAIIKLIFLQVSGLFEEFFYFAKHYSWIKDENKVKQTFMKVLEKFTAKEVSIVDVKQVKNFLQKEIFTISSSVNEASIDFEIYNRYNFIVSDLIKRKLSRTPAVVEILTTTRPPLITPSKRKPVRNYLGQTTPPAALSPPRRKIVNHQSTKTRPHSWKPGKTPNSPMLSQVTTLYDNATITPW